MKHVDLETYTNFTCSGGKCPYTCCGGWRISVDESTVGYYESVPGKLGERLKASISRENNRSSFVLDENGYCSFLNEQRLCDLVLELGEEHLCKTCRYFPRFTYFFGNIRFAGVSIACPEVAGYLLRHEEPLRIDVFEDDLMLKDMNKYDTHIIEGSLQLLECSLNIAQCRRLSISERIAVILIMMRQYQNYHDSGKDTGVLTEVFSDFVNVFDIARQSSANGRDYSSKIEFCFEVMDYYSQIEDFNIHLPMLSELIDQCFSDVNNNKVATTAWIDAYDWINSEAEMIWQEQLLFYVLFRYIMNAIPDGYYYGQTAMGIIIIFELIRGIIILLYVCHNQTPSFDRKMLTMVRVSRLVEHDGQFRKLAWQHFEEKGMTDLLYLLKLIS